MGQYSRYNAQEVLNRVEARIAENRAFLIKDVCEELSIFDWWSEKLSRNRLNAMRNFLKEAIKLGYTGYVCFKVGAAGCADGMWAAVNESEDGYSPKGPTLYRSFTPSYLYWDVTDKDGNWDWEGKYFDEADRKDNYDRLRTTKQLEQFMEVQKDHVYINK